MKKELITERNPKSPIAEVFRTLRTNIQFMNAKKSIESLLITSPMPGEGKTWIASNLAITFAQAGKKVALVDADMRKGKLHKMFQLDLVPGLSNYLCGVDESGKLSNEDKNNILKYVRQTEVENLFVIPAGNFPPNPSELLTSDLTSQMLESLKDYFDIVLIDGTPSLLVSDAIILSRLVDTTIIVTAYKTTKKDNLEKIKRAIENVGGKIAGVVINKKEVNVDKYESTYYYSSSMSKSERRDIREIVEENTDYKDIYTSNNSLNIETSENVSKEKADDILKKLDDYLKNNSDNNGFQG